MSSGRTTNGGRSVRRPRRWETTAPAWGELTPPVKRRPVCIICQPASWTAAPSWWQERTRENLSATAAWRGRSSESSKASVFVRIGLKGPRTSALASGFMSHKSTWLGAPRLKIMMHDRFS
jgi:hypothetical protein